MSAVFDENTQFVDTAGKPLLNGEIWIGLQNADPVANPITIYSDRGLTSVLANPQALDSSGRSTNKIWVPGAYSVRVNDSAGVQQYQALDNGELADVGISILGNVLGTNAITADGSPTISALTDQQVYTFKVANTNTDAITLAIDATGAKDVVRNIDQAVVSGQFVQNEVVMVQYNITTDQYNWVQQNQKVHYTGKGADIASAATVDLALATGNSVVITGATGPITSFGTTPAGTIFDLTFTGTPTITHNGTSLIIPGAANVVIVAGDQVRVESLGSGNVQIQVFRQDGTSVVGQQIIQMVRTSDGEAASTTNTITKDDSIMQNTEGAEFMTRAITPSSTTNRLLITVTIVLTNNGTDPGCFVGIFQDSTANALKSGLFDFPVNGNSGVTVTFSHEMAAGTVSSTTFKVRAASTASTTTMNGVATASRLGGGVLASSITILELKS